MTATHQYDIPASCLVQLITVNVGVEVKLDGINRHNLVTAVILAGHGPQENLGLLTSRDIN